ncbi:hypothetical protein N7470_004235 [Penicillium chermesinum]|nr:hypothetical protein N7470_004235 [Penicillium chermesinum]
MTDPSPRSPPEQQKKEALAAFTATLHSVGTNLEAPLRDRAAVINENARALAKQEAELAESGQKLAKQNAQWEKITDDTRAGLKEIGDVQNWAEMIERDLQVLEEMMDGVEADQEEEDRRERQEREERANAMEVDGHERANGDGMNQDVDGKKTSGKSWLRWW